ncbi:MAG: hypothetical protein LUH56_06285 [Oscillospiraceae bacterium]|nr:hypothetical protein [Oscillospiraceae bacterium]
MKNQLSGIALILSGILFEVATVPTEVLGLYFFTSLFFALGLIPSASAELFSQSSVSRMVRKNKCLLFCPKCKRETA